MNNDFSFGPFNTKDIRLSLYGMAIKNKSGKWVSYDKTTHRLMDVEVFNIDIDSTKVFYKIPKAVNDVVAGDIILHNGKPMFVEEVLNNNKFAVIDPYEGTAITILAPVSPFGFNFITKIVSLTDCMPEASEDNPFGNLLPFMLGDNNSLMLAMMLNKGAGDIRQYTITGAGTIVITAVANDYLGFVGVNVPKNLAEKKEEAAE